MIQRKLRKIRVSWLCSLLCMFCIDLYPPRPTKDSVSYVTDILCVNANTSIRCLILLIQLYWHVYNVDVSLAVFPNAYIFGMFTVDGVLYARIVLL